jgi:hypothetical protein
MVASPDGTSIILLGGNGVAYSYDALSDSFTSSRTLATGGITGYYGALAVGPDSLYVAANALATNRALAPISVGHCADAQHRRGCSYRRRALCAPDHSGARQPKCSDHHRD